MLQEIRHKKIGIRQSQNGQELTSINDSYDKIADVYDQEYQDKVSIAENIILAKYLKDYCNGLVYDLGCGTGLFLDLVKPQMYIGFDTSKKMIEVARKKHTHNMFIVGDVQEGFKTQFPLKIVDNIVCLFCFNYFFFPTLVLYNISKSLKRGGKFFIIMGANKYYNRKSYILKKHNIRTSKRSYSIEELNKLFGSFFMDFKITPFNGFLVNKNLKYIPQWLVTLFMRCEMPFLRYDNCNFYIISGTKTA